MEVRQSTTVGGEEISRKLIHLSGSVATALLVLLAPPRQARGLLLGAAATAVLIEIARTLSPGINALFVRTVGSMLRYRERQGLTGATTMAIGFVATTFTVPPALAAAAILMSGTGDAAGALVGRRFGKFRLLNGKSLEGSIACLGAAFGTALLVPGISPLMASAAALVTATLELTVSRVDDNLFLPLAAALTLRALAGIG
jgi:dolichol kinase